MKGFVFSFLILQLSFINQVLAITNYHFKTQYAGEIGVAAFGGGAKFYDFISLDFLYGVIPASIDSEKIETIAVKNHYEFEYFKVGSSEITPYLGLSLFHVLGKKYKTSQSSNYPNNYYAEASLRGYFFGGVEFSSITQNKNSIYLEMGINDIWLINYLNNFDVIDVRDYISLGLGWNYKI